METKLFISQSAAEGVIIFSISCAFALFVYSPALPSLRAQIGTTVLPPYISLNSLHKSPDRMPLQIAFI